ncbi:putative homocysteine S-methyltransferase [Talaromyces proteolyticus]|uniref:Homocysteine S-methyltransferase n=1 Tax=Talaromyces proteolyticus TaxID=1131652 RepID=A0AAD4L4V8_9EURO|nr:putative homocysteine S-methyltransferase [Talaromyces proteolyticus]KAH8706012.1 putative homocysteine S-methyltransferase [Talaromyces proteolyticus]
MTVVQILDGGLGTSLQDKYGVVFDKSTPMWASHLLVTDPTTLLACQRDFVDVGIDVLLTATYQISAEGFGRTKTARFPDGIPRQAVSPFLKAALDVAEQAVGARRTKIALSLGPYGATMSPGQEYSGQYDAEHDNENALYNWHVDRLQLFLEADHQLSGRVAYIAFETLPRIDEIRAVRKAVHAVGLTSIPFWISCVFPGKGKALPDGSSIEEITAAAIAPMRDGASPWGIGINCTKIHKLAGLIDSFGDSVTKMIATGQIQAAPTLVLYPDGTNGEIYNTLTQKWEKPDGLAAGYERDMIPWEIQFSRVLDEARTKCHFQSFLVGGCCKATSDDIERLARQVLHNV